MIPSKTQPKSLASKHANLMKDTKSSALRNSAYQTLQPEGSPKKSPGRSSKKKSGSPLSKSKTSAHLNSKGMIISLKSTPSKDDERLFQDNNITKVNPYNPDSLNTDLKNEYTLEGISGMVIMDRSSDDEIQKGESATSAKESDSPRSQEKMEVSQAHK